MLDDRAAPNRGSVVDWFDAVTERMPLMGPDELLREFVRHRELIHGYVFALTADHNVAEDILQDVGVSILGEVQRGTNPENVLLWLRGLARHRVADHYRRTAARERHETQFEQFADIVDQAFMENGTSSEVYDDQRELLRACLEDLTERVRRIVDLRYSLGNSIDEIAAAMAWTPASIKVALSRARRTLADCVSRKTRREEALR